MMTFRPFGPRVTFTALASLAIPRFIASRASWSHAICLALMGTPVTGRVCSGEAHGRPSVGLRVLLDHRQHVFLMHDEDFVGILAVLELVAGPGGEEHLVAGLQLHRHAGAGLDAELAGADGEDHPALRLLLGGVGEQDAAGGLRVGRLAADDDAVADRLQVHARTPVGTVDSTRCGPEVQEPCLWHGRATTLGLGMSYTASS